MALNLAKVLCYRGRGIGDGKWMNDGCFHRDVGGRGFREVGGGRRGDG